MGPPSSSNSEMHICSRCGRRVIFLELGNCMGKMCDFLRVDVLLICRIFLGGEKKKEKKKEDPF